MSQLAFWLATCGSLGERLPAPGSTVGSLVGLSLAVALPSPWSWALWAAVCAAAVWACGLEARRRGEGDPGAVVLDEVVGQWLTWLVLQWAAFPPTLATAALAFGGFRLLDVLKPPPVRQLEQLPGGWGIVVDDLAAGGLAVALLATLKKLGILPI